MLIDLEITGTFSLSSAVVGLDTSLSRCCDARVSEGPERALGALAAVDEADEEDPQALRTRGSAGRADART